MKKEIHNILILGATNKKNNIDLTDSIYKTCELINKLNYKVYLLTENPISIFAKSNILSGLIIDKVTPETVNQVIEKFRIDSIIPTLGDRNGLSIIAANKFPDKVTVLGSNYLSAIATFNRGIFSNHLEKNNLPVISYISTKNEDEIYDFVRRNSFPVILRRRFENRLSSGWTNIDNLYDLNNFIEHDAEFNDAVEIEKSIQGQREFSITTLRDSSGNINQIGAIEDIQPIGIHHLDSLLVTPTLTLTDTQIQKLRNAALKVVEAFNIIGVCTTHFALSTTNQNEFYITEIIPRLSEETHFLEQAYNYNISEISTQLNLGMTIDKLIDSSGNKLNAAFEPNIDHLCMRVPTWSNIQEVYLEPKKNSNGSFIIRANNIDELFKKGPLNAQITQTNLINSANYKSLNEDELFEKIMHPTNRQLSILKTALNRGFDVQYLSDITKIHPVYLDTLKQLSKLKLQLVKNKGDISILRQALISGFSISEISKLWKLDTPQLIELIQQSDIQFQLKETSFVTNSTRSFEYISSIGNHSEFTSDDNSHYIVIKSVPETSTAQQVKNNYILSRLSQISEKNGFSTLIFDRANRSLFNNINCNTIKILDPFDELNFFMNKSSCDYIINFSTNSNDKDGLLDESDTKIFEDTTIKSNEYLELSVIKDSSDWIITSSIFTNESENSTLVTSKIIEDISLKEEIDNFFKNNLSLEQKKNAKLFTFTFSNLNNNKKLKKVSIGFGNNIIAHDIVSPIDLIDTYIKLLIGFKLSELNIKINKFKFIEHEKPKAINYKDDNYLLDLE